VKVQHTLTASKMKHVTALCPSAAELDLSHNHLGDKGVAFLVRALQVGVGSSLSDPSPDLLPRGSTKRSGLRA
jgi:hypothetical protein